MVKVEAMRASITSSSLWCLSLLDEEPKALKRVSETETEIMYSTLFPDAPSSDVHMSFTLSNPEGHIIGLRKWAPKKYKPMPFVKFTTFDMTAECKTSPDGRAYASDVNFRMIGSNFGKKVDKDIRQHISDLKLYSP